MLEVYLKYPDELNELHNDYPLTTGNLEISHDILSKYCCNIANKYDIKIDDVNKLVPILCNKSKYAPYYRNLQLYFSLGMELTKFHIIPTTILLVKKNTLILIQKKEKMLSIDLKKILLSW